MRELTVSSHDGIDERPADVARHVRSLTMLRT
jgi:hypothetical protein